MCSLAPPTDTKTVAGEQESRFCPIKSIKADRKWRRRPLSSRTHLLDVDPVQRPDLLGRRGGLGLVVSVSLTTETSCWLAIVTP